MARHLLIGPAEESEEMKHALHAAGHNHARASICSRSVLATFGGAKLALAIAVFATPLASAGAPALGGQAPGQHDASSVATVIATYRVRHKHAIGSGTGELLIRMSGFEFRGRGDEARHSRAWRDDDLKRVELSREHIKLVVYEAGSVPVLPRQLPFVDETKAIPAGSEHTYEFELVGDDLSPSVVAAVLARFPRPVASSVVPGSVDQLGRLLLEVPVFHRHRVGG